MKIFLGLHSKDELGMEHSNSRLMASKSFHRAERPKVFSGKPNLLKKDLLIL